MIRGASGLKVFKELGLPDEVLRKVYVENALKLIPGLREDCDAVVKRGTP